MEIDNNDMTLICDALVMMSDVQKYKKRKIENLLGRLDAMKKEFDSPSTKHDKNKNDNS